MRLVRTGRRLVRVAAALASALAADALAQQPPILQLPVACEVGRTCFVQKYVDVDPSPAAMDYQCGTLTSDGHDGIDLRLPTMAAQRAGVDVLAAADGRVARLRDGMADNSVRGAEAAEVRGFECGNGLVIEHADGWETQYCHLASGSLKVRPGDPVKAGQAIGRVGLSGLTQYPHLHFAIRYRGNAVDPFAYQASPGACGGGVSLWQESLRPSLAYRPRTALNVGFAASLVTLESVEADDGERDPVSSDAAALVAYVRAIGLKVGDIQTLTLTGPAGNVVAQNRSDALQTNRAQSLLYAGRQRPAGGWSRGAYRADYVVTQAGDVVLERSFSFDLR
jgi:hypothetical protein